MLENPQYLRYSTEMTDDPFSTILKFIAAETIVSGGFTAGGSWAIRFPLMDKIKFSAIVKGTCWLLIDGHESPVQIETGDVFLFTEERSFTLASDLERKPVEAASVFLNNAANIVKLNDGDDFFQIGGFIRLDPISGSILLDVLPSHIHIKADSPHAMTLRWILDQLVEEQKAERPGSSIASAQLAQLMFVQILRAHLETVTFLPSGLLRAINDPLIVPALRLMHNDPGRDWHLDELARAVVMSRTTFALRFKLAAGVTPLAYLTEWRMRLAERTLREETTPISSIAASLGYTSISSFSNAFRRITGKSPQRYRSTERTF